MRRRARPSGARGPIVTVWPISTHHTNALLASLILEPSGIESDSGLELVCWSGGGGELLATSRSAHQSAHQIDGPDNNIALSPRERGTPPSLISVRNCIRDEGEEKRRTDKNKLRTTAFLVASWL